MSLFYVTGLAGTGKSAICQELVQRGYEAYDADDNLARWVDTQTGYNHPKSSIKATDRTAEFLSHHEWVIPRPAVQELAEQAHDKTMYLCGVSDNGGELFDLFRGVFALVVDEKTLRHRLLHRPANDWGKQPHEIAATLSWQKSFHDMYVKYGHTIIDAAQPLDTVVDEIVTTADKIELA